MASRKTHAKARHGFQDQSEEVGEYVGSGNGMEIDSTANESEMPWDAFRPCKFCRMRFKPKHKAAKDKQFCCENHRKRYHETGQMPFYKLMDRVESIVAREVAALAHRVEELENRLREERS